MVATTIRPHTPTRAQLSEMTGDDTDLLRALEDLFDTVNTELPLTVLAGYGGITQSSPVGIADIGAGWVTLVADTAVIGTPRGVDQLITTNALSLNAGDVWNASISFSLTHNEVNFSRTFNVRLFNITQGSGGPETVIGVGRNTDTTTFASAFLVNIPSDQIGDDFRVEIGGTADAITAVVENSFSFNVNHVSGFSI